MMRHRDEAERGRKEGWIDGREECSTLINKFQERVGTMKIMMKIIIP